MRTGLKRMYYEYVEDPLDEVAYPKEVIHGSGHEGNAYGCDNEGLEATVRELKQLLARNKAIMRTKYRETRRQREDP